MRAQSNWDIAILLYRSCKKRSAELSEVIASQAIKTWKKVENNEEVKEGDQAPLDGPVSFPTTRFNSYVGWKDAIRNFKIDPQALPNICICFLALKLFPMLMSSVGSERTANVLVNCGWIYDFPGRMDYWNSNQVSKISEIQQLADLWHIA